MILMGGILLAAIFFILGAITGSGVERGLQREDKKEGYAEAEKLYKNFLNYDGTEQE